ncbi:MAG: hypothetical protein E6K99_08190, partial [Thaumarchaeota archaeon]
MSKSNLLGDEKFDPISRRARPQAARGRDSLHLFIIRGKFDDDLDVSVWVRKMGNSSIIFDFEVKRDRTALADGYIVNVLVNAAGKPVRLPERVRLKLSRN